MRTAGLLLLLLSFFATTSQAGELSDLFQEDFGDPPTAGAAGPPTKIVPLGVPSPRLRPAPVPVVERVPVRSQGVLPLVAVGPAMPAGNSPIKSMASSLQGVPNPSRIEITWNPLDPNWDGMFLTNSGDKPFTLLEIEFNNRKDCVVRPYSLTKIRKFIDLSWAIKKWGEKAINLFGLPNVEGDSVLAPDLASNGETPAVNPEASEVRVGGRVPVFNGTKCNPIAGAAIETETGRVTLHFVKPYRGH